MPDYAQTMARLRNEDLLRVARGAPHSEYEVEAIEAAQRELERRDLPDDEIVDIDQQLGNERTEYDHRPNMELTNAEMISFLLIGPLLLISIPLAVLFFARGYPKKARGAFGAILLSYALYALLVGAILALAWLFGF